MKINKPVGPYPFWTWDFASQSLWRSPILAEVECCKGQSTGHAASCPGFAAISGNPEGFREDKEVTLPFLRGEKISLMSAFNSTTLQYENPGGFYFLHTHGPLEASALLWLGLETKLSSCAQMGLILWRTSASVTWPLTKVQGL